jgi:hypothetical protein
MNLKIIEWAVVDWIHLTQDTDKCWALLNAGTDFQEKAGKFMTQQLLASQKALSSISYLVVMKMSEKSLIAFRVLLLHSSV